MWLKTVLTISLLTFVLHTSDGNILRRRSGHGQENEQCPLSSKRKMESFDYNQFAGDWFVVFVDKKIMNTKCSLFNFNPVDRGEMTEVSYNTERDTFHTSFLRADRPRESGDNGQLRFSMSLRGFFSGVRTLHYLVLDTDYQNYAVVYTCSDIPPSPVDRVIVFSRTPSVNEVFYDTVDMILQDNELPTLTSLEEHPQDCGDIVCTGEKIRKCGYKQAAKSREKIEELTDDY